MELLIFAIGFAVFSLVYWRSETRKESLNIQKRKLDAHWQNTLANALAKRERELERYYKDYYRDVLRNHELQLKELESHYSETLHYQKLELQLYRRTHPAYTTSNVVNVTVAGPTYTQTEQAAAIPPMAACNRHYNGITCPHLTTKTTKLIE